MSHGGERPAPGRTRGHDPGSGRPLRWRRLVLGVQEQIAVEQEHQEQDQARRAGHHERRSPAQLQREPHHDDGCERVTEIAAKCVKAVGPAVAGAADARGEDGEIGRVEHAVPEPGDHGKRKQHPECGRKPHQQDRDAEQGETAQQHDARRETVDQETRRGLGDTGAHVEHGHQRAELGVADRERLLEMGEEWRQGELIEVARAVGECDQAHDAGLPAPGRLLNGHRGASRMGAAPTAAPGDAGEYVGDTQGGNGRGRAVKQAGIARPPRP